MELKVVDSFTAWRDDRHFTKNPDIVRLPSGKLLCVFNLTNAHVVSEYAKITLIESEDGGYTWGNPKVIDESFPKKGEERWVTPRITLLRDGRLVVICDQNDYRHSHETQPPGIYAWWSEDGGETWSKRLETGIPGVEPDRVRELPDGTLIVCSHYTFTNTIKLGEVALRSFDGGKTWGALSVIASDKVHNYCEGAIVPLSSGRIACILRENNHSNYPSYISFSDDDGATWSKPVEAPFSGDRPFAEQIDDGRVLVTFRNQAGRAGTYAWIGDIEKESGYKVSVSGGGFTHRVVAEQKDQPAKTGESYWDPQFVRLSDEALVLDGDLGVTRYCLLPPESEYSSVTLKTRLKLQGEPNKICAHIQIARIGVQLQLYPNMLSLGPSQNPNLRQPVDMTGWRDLVVEYKGGMIEVFVDGVSTLRKPIHRETLWDRSFIGLHTEPNRSLSLKAISYTVRNPSEPDHDWAWSVSDGVYPNQYELDRWLEVERNTNVHPDNGYSSWLRMPDGKFLVLDYTNRYAPAGKAYLMGYMLELL